MRRRKKLRLEEVSPFLARLDLGRGAGGAATGAEGMHSQYQQQHSSLYDPTGRPPRAHHGRRGPATSAAAGGVIYPSFPAYNGDDGAEEAVGMGMGGAGRSLRAYKKGGVRYGDAEFGFGFDATPYEGKFPPRQAGAGGAAGRGHRTGLTPDVGLLGFGSPQAGKSPIMLSGSAGLAAPTPYFATGMTPGGDGTPLSEIASNYSNGISPGYSPSIFCLLDNSPRLGDSAHKPVDSSSGRLAAGALSAAKAAFGLRGVASADVSTDADSPSSANNSSLNKSALVKRKLQAGDEEDEAAGMESSFARTDSPSESGTSLNVSLASVDAKDLASTRFVSVYFLPSSLISSPLLSRSPPSFPSLSTSMGLSSVLA